MTHAAAVGGRLSSSCRGCSEPPGRAAGGGLPCGQPSLSGGAALRGGQPPDSGEEPDSGILSAREGPKPSRYLPPRPRRGSSSPRPRSPPPVVSHRGPALMPPGRSGPVPSHRRHRGPAAASAEPGRGRGRAWVLRVSVSAVVPPVLVPRVVALPIGATRIPPCPLSPLRPPWAHCWRVSRVTSGGTGHGGLLPLAPGVQLCPPSSATLPRAAPLPTPAVQSWAALAPPSPLLEAPPQPYCLVPAGLAWRGRLPETPPISSSAPLPTAPPAGSPLPAVLPCPAPAVPLAGE